MLTVVPSQTNVHDFQPHQARNGDANADKFRIRLKRANLENYIAKHLSQFLHAPRE